MEPVHHFSGVPVLQNELHYLDVLHKLLHLAITTFEHLEHLFNPFLYLVLEVFSPGHWGFVFFFSCLMGGLQKLEHCNLVASCDLLQKVKTSLPARGLGTDHVLEDQVNNKVEDVSILHLHDLLEFEFKYTDLLYELGKGRLYFIHHRSNYRV